MKQRDSMMTDDTQSLRSGALNQSSSPAGTQEPVAWRWRMVGSELWIYDPEPEWRERHKDDTEVEWSPLYAAPASQDATREALIKALTEIANHPENKQSTRIDESSYGVGWAFWNVQHIARAALASPARADRAVTADESTKP